MDATDRRIIRELQRNGRQTNNELAERVNLSPSPCLRRVRRLEADGVIRGYTAIVDQEKYGVPINVFVSIRLERHSEESVRAFEAHIHDVDEIMACYLMTGSNDYLMHVVSDSLSSYEHFMKRCLNTIPGIASIESNFALGMVKRKHELPRLAQFGHGSDGA